MLEQIIDRHREIVIRQHEARAARHDAVAVVVGIAREGDVVLVFQSDQTLHRVGRRGIHANAPSQSARHEPKRGVDIGLEDGQIESIVLGDARPIVHACAAERIDAHARLGAANHIEVDDVAEVRDIGADEIVFLRRRRLARACASGIPLHAVQVDAISAFARCSIHLVTSVSAGPPFGGLYLKPPPSGGLCDGVMTMPSASPRSRPRL